MLKKFNFFAFIILIFAFQSFADKNEFIESCFIPEERNTLVGGWFEWEPYQYEIDKKYTKELTGLDIELTNAVFKNIGLSVKHEQVKWDQHLDDIKKGNRDIAPGSTFTAQRAQFARFTIPYRFEENSLFVSKRVYKSLYFKDIKEFLAQIRAINFRIGILSGSVFGDDHVNQFMNDPQNNDIIFRSDDDITNLRALIRSDIDGFITDRLVGASLLTNNKVGSLVHEIPLGIKTPISFMMSKKSVPENMVDDVNRAINEVRTNGEYSQISKKYLFPILLIQIINSSWFYYVNLLGVISFGISGVLIGFRENATIFKTFLFAALPCLFPGLVRDYLIDDSMSSIENVTFYFIIVAVVVLFGFAAMRLLDAFNKDADSDDLVQNFIEKSIIYLDALGQSAFVVPGVTFALLSRLNPIEVWGTLFAFLVASTGCILRDLLTDDKKLSLFCGDLNPEITILWGFLFSLYLDYSSDNPSQLVTSLVVIFLVVSAFISRHFTKKYKLANLKFK
jgi:polar amino acid transport system substrate-binding protein